MIKIINSNDTYQIFYYAVMILLKNYDTIKIFLDRGNNTIPI